MTRRSVEIDLKANSKAAISELRKLERASKDTDEAVEGIETAGKTMARALEQAADDAIAELAATRRAVDKLETALDDVEFDPNQLVADLKRAGLTAQDIEADADDLAAALKRAGDVKIRAKDLGFDDVDQALGRTSESSRVTSTAIGGIGNSISELPGVGSLGPVAESMGMLAENALEGEASIKGLVVAGAGLAGLGLAVGFVQQRFRELAEIKAFSTEQVDDWTEAIYEAEEAVDGLIDSYRQAGRIEIRTLLDGIKDITPQLAQAGVSIDEWTGYVSGGEEALTDLIDRLKIAGVGGDQLRFVMEGLVFAQDSYRQATQRAEERTKVFGKDAQAATEEVQRLGRALESISGEYEGRITIDTVAANESLRTLIGLLDAAGIKASQLSILSANRFNTGQNTVVLAPAGADLDWMARNQRARTGRAI
jgi:hypothetical protein